MNKLDNIYITELSQKQSLLDQTISYFWKCWGSENNFNFYKNCIEFSVQNPNSLPKFYVAFLQQEIIASYALLTNDIISRQDLVPWLACLFVDERYRKQKIAEKLLSHALNETKRLGFGHLYLSTDLENFYERKGWSFIGIAYNIFDEEFKIYQNIVL